MKNIRKIIVTVLIPVFMLGNVPVFSEGEVRIGTTYSQVQSAYLELDDKETYLLTLEEGFDLVRLGSYWNEIEKEKDVYDFSALDWQLSKAEEKNVSVVLTVGMKAPRWPEYFIPDWVMKKASFSFGKDVSKNAYLRERTLKFIKEVVERYKNKEIIKYWQVENEALNKFGGDFWYIGKEFLREEITLVRELDGGKRKIVLTAATYPNSFLRFFADISVKHDPIEENLAMCDVLGLNVYPIVGHKTWGLRFYFRTGEKGRQKYFSRLLDRIKEKGKKAWIIEFQAEPWEPGRLVYTDKAPPITARALEMEKTLDEFLSMGFKTILLWGSEYWQFRKGEYKDEKWILAVRRILRRAGK
ncbi:MAG: beta-galactosidase [Candidatus Omnitrophota bacterium]